MASLSFSDAQCLDQLAIALDFFTLQIIKEASALPDQFQQPAASAKIFRMLFEVFRNGIDPLGEKSNLHFRGTGV